MWLRLQTHPSHSTPFGWVVGNRGAERGALESWGGSCESQPAVLLPSKAPVSKYDALGMTLRV